MENFEQVSDPDQRKRVDDLEKTDNPGEIF